MRLILRLYAVLLVASALSPAAAQVEYFTNGERVISGSGFLQWAEVGPNSSGLQIGATVTPRLELTLGFARADFYKPGVFAATRTEYLAWSAGAVFFASRQNVDGPLTVGFGLRAGGVNVDDGVDTIREPVVGIGVRATHAGSNPGSMLILAPNAGFDLSVVLDDTGAATTQVYEVGLGVGFRVAPTAVVAFNPSLAFVNEPGGTASIAATGTVGVSITY